MPATGSEYALLQKKLRHDNMLQQVYSHRSKAIEREKYLLASERDNLEEQWNNLQNGVEKLSPALQRYYMGKIAELDGTLWLLKSVSDVSWQLWRVLKSYD